MKRILCAALIGGGALLACETPLSPETGGISLNILTITSAPSGGSLASSPELGQAAQSSALPLDSARVVLTGPTPKTMSVTPGTTVTIPDLLAGQYTVSLEGWAGGVIGYAGQISNVTVTAQETNSIADVLFAPTTLDFIALDDSLQLSVSAGASPTWQSSNTGVATVSTTGVITAISNGQATITGTVGSSQVTILAAVAQEVATVTVTPPTATIAAGVSQLFTAAADDANGNPVFGVNFFFASSNHNVATVDQGGLAQGLGGGSVTITAVGDGEPGSASLVVGAEQPTQLAFNVDPTNISAGGAISPAIQVEIRDAAGGLIETARDAVTLSVGSNPGGGTILGTATVNAVNGIATFSGVSIDKLGTGYTLAAGSGLLTGATSATFDVNAAAATKLAFTADPSATLAGATVSPNVTVTVQDAFDNTVSTAATVTMEITTNGGGGTLSGTLAVAAVGGVATFSDLSIEKAGTYALGATSGALAGAGSTAFDIASAAAAQLSFVAQPGNGEPQAILAPSIQVSIQDAFGNTVTSATDVVNLVIGTNPGAGVLSGTASLAAVSGVATFNDLTIDAAGGGYTLDASSGVLTVGSSTPFDVFIEFISLAIGDFHACGVTTTGNAYCWGNDGQGQLGNGAPTAQFTTPQLVVGGHKWASVTVGNVHTCAIRATDDAAFCWGDSPNGKLGNGTTTPDQPAPVAVLGGHTFTSVSANAAHTCGVRTDGAALCWGAASFGRLGNGATTPDQTNPVVVLGGHTFTSVSTGNLHTCGVRATDYAVLCWGNAANGRLGNGTTTPDQTSPVLVLGGNTFTSVSAGNLHTCGVRTDGLARCWGAAANGRLGNGLTTPDQSIPVTVNNGIRFATVDVGLFHSCGVAAGSSAAFCWGDAIAGELGNGTTTPDQLKPDVVLGGLQFSQIVVGMNGGTCGATTSGGYCWGFNASGQLGNGNTIQSTVPTLVTGSR